MADEDVSQTDELVDNTAADDAVLTNEQEAAEVDKGGSDSKTVPIEALHEAREQNRQLRADLERRDNRMDSIQQRLDDMSKPDETQEDIEIPDFADNPQGNIDARFTQLETLIQNTAQQTQVNANSGQQTAVMQELNNAINQDRQKFTSEHADIDAARAYHSNLMVTEMKEAGMAERDAIRAVANAEMSMSAMALDNGKSPSKISYDRAVRAGYKSTGAKIENTADLEDAASMGGSGSPSVQDMLDAEEDEFDGMFKDLGYGNKMT